MRRLGLLLPLLLAAPAVRPAAVTPEAAPVPPAIEVPAAQDGEESAQAETRLRKLHLVRPDLIPYPLSYDVYC